MPTIEDYPDDMLLHSLIDGDLSDTQQQETFARLNADAGLQRRYRELVRLQSAMQEDARSLFVPPEATAAVFGALGLAVPETVSSATAAGSASANPQAAATTAEPATATTAGTAPQGAALQTAAHVGWWSAHWGAALLGGLGLMAVVAVFLRNPDSPSSEMRQSREAGPAAQMESVAPTVSRIPSSRTGGRAPATVAVGETPRRSGPAALDTAWRQHRVYPQISFPPAPAPAATPAARKEEAPSEAASAAAVAAVAATPDANTTAPGITRTEHTEPPTTAAATIATNPDARPPLSGLLLMLRYTPGTQVPSVGVASQSATSLRDFALGAGYALGDRDRAGLELGREAFPQTFGRLENGLYARYWQKPLEYWLAAFYERSFGRLLTDRLTAYARADAGGVMEIGPMLRGGAGLRFTLAPMLELHAGAEGTIVAYRFESLWLTSKKYGATAGLTVAF